MRIATVFNQLKQGQQIWFPKVENVVVEKVKVESQFLKTLDSRLQHFFAFSDHLGHKLFADPRRKTQVDCAVLPLFLVIDYELSVDFLCLRLHKVLNQHSN